MGSVALSWNPDISVDDSDDVRTVTCGLTITLIGCPSGAQVSGVCIIKIGVVYFDADNVMIGVDGNPLPASQAYSHYEEVVRQSGSGGSPLTVTAQKVNHGAGAVCGAHKPASAVKASYRYYAVAEHSSAGCSGCNATGVLGPVSPSFGYVFFTQGGGGGGE